jgi:hypothetical protein
MRLTKQNKDTILDIVVEYNGLQIGILILGKYAGQTRGRAYIFHCQRRHVAAYWQYECIALVRLED